MSKGGRRGRHAGNSETAEEAADMDLNVVKGMVELTAGSQFEIPVIAYEGCVLVWSFQTTGGDIGFGMSFKADEISLETDDDDSKKAPQSMVNLLPGEDIVLAKVQRYHSHQQAVNGRIQVARSGTVTLTWDNSYSYFNSKNLHYFVELEEPIGGQSGARALGGIEMPKVLFVLGGPGA